MKTRYLPTLKGFILVLLVSVQGPPASGAPHDGADATTRTWMVENYGQLPLHFEANLGQSDPPVKFISHGGNHTLLLAPTEMVLILRKPAPARPENSETPRPSFSPEDSRAQDPARRPSGPPKTVYEKGGPGTPGPGLVLHMKLLGTNPQPLMIGVEELPGKVHYLIGKDPEKWLTHVPTYAKVQGRQVYPGVDLVYYGNQRHLEYDWVVAPGADPRLIRFVFEGANGLEVNPGGDLILHTSGGQIRQRKPLIYQEINGVRQEIPGGYVLNDRQQVGFQVGAYDASKPLVIDPLLVYSTYLGGSSQDFGFDIAVDTSGNAYLTGQTLSTDFPTARPLQTNPCAGEVTFCVGGDAFVMKLNPIGSAFVYATYLGGTHSDVGRGIAVDPSGNVYVTGDTFSTDFPTTPEAFDKTCGTDGECNLSFDTSFSDAFVAKLNPTGSALVYATYLGGSDTDRGAGIALDASGHAYVTGSTRSANFPVENPLQPTFSGNTCGDPAELIFPCSDAFVTKLNPTGSALIYSTYLGGGGEDDGKGIAVNSSGHAYMTGGTRSTDFPTASPLQAACALDEAGACIDAFVAKLNPTGSALTYATYLGGNGGDDGTSIAVDTSGHAYVAGGTRSTDFPTASPLQAACALDEAGACIDAFVVKLNPTGSALTYATYLGGSSFEFANDVAVDASGNAYVVGSTTSANFPTASPLQATCVLAQPGSCYADAFVTKLNPTGSALIYSTYLGGSGDDGGSGIAVDLSGSAYVIGSTASTNFPTSSPLQPGCSPDVFKTCSGDAFIAKIATPGTLPGDLDGNGDIDGGDLNILLAARSASTLDPKDPRDLDGDGKITVSDARKLVLLCTRPKCDMR